MCGRVALFSPPVRLARLLEATLAAGIDPESGPRYNVGPQQTLFGVALEEGDRVLSRYRWGLVPSWAKSTAVSNRLFNARAETIAEKPSFRAAFARRPCVVPVDGFFEWDHRPGRNSQPHYFSRVDGEPLVLAGLYEHWRDPEAVEVAPVVTCTIITTSPNDDLEGIHDRMPVILELNDVTTWLDVTSHDAEERLTLLASAPAGTLAHHGVSRAVGSTRHDSASLITPSEPSSLF